MRHEESLPAAPAGSKEEIAFREGFLVGILVGEGHFGGDGKQPQVTLRMHTRHSQLFDWIQTNFPGGKLFGPYFHGGRHYLQWMARGRFLREVLVPILSRRLTAAVDIKSYGCFMEMLATYGLAPREPQPAESAAAAAAAATAETTAAATAAATAETTAETAPPTVAPASPRPAAALAPSASAPATAARPGKAADSHHV